MKHIQKQRILKWGLISTLVFLFVSFILLFVIAIPIPINQIGFIENPNNQEQFIWDIYYNDSDQEYLGYLKQLNISKPDLEFSMTLVSNRAIKYMSINLLFDMERYDFIINTRIKTKPTYINGLYYYSLPKLPYDRLKDYP
jgi:hypothetical protein